MTEQEFQKMFQANPQLAHILLQRLENAPSMLLPPTGMDASHVQVDNGPLPPSYGRPSDTRFQAPTQKVWLPPIPQPQGIPPSVANPSFPQPAELSSLLPGEKQVTLADLGGDAPDLSSLIKQKAMLESLQANIPQEEIISLGNSRGNEFVVLAKPSGAEVLEGAASGMIKGKAEGEIAAADRKAKDALEKRKVAVEAQRAKQVEARNKLEADRIANAVKREGRLQTQAAERQQLQAMINAGNAATMSGRVDIQNIKKQMADAENLLTANAQLIDVDEIALGREKMSVKQEEIAANLEEIKVKLEIANGALEVNRAKGIHATAELENEVNKLTQAGKELEFRNRQLTVANTNTDEALAGKLKIAAGTAATAAAANKTANRKLKLKEKEFLAKLNKIEVKSVREQHLARYDAALQLLREKGLYPAAMRSLNAPTGTTDLGNATQELVWLEGVASGKISIPPDAEDVGIDLNQYFGEE